MNINKSSYFASLLPVVASLCVLLLSACSGKKPYKITGTVEGLGTQNITAIYLDGASLKEVTTNAVNSEFHFEGSTESPRVIELYDKLRNRIGCLVVSNGEEVKVKFKAGQPLFMEVTGNELSASLASFLGKNADNLNAAIEQRIATIPSDELSSLLATYYYDINLNRESADSILSLLGDDIISSNPLLLAKKQTAVRLAAPSAPVDTLRLFASTDTIVKYAPSAKTNTLLIFNDFHTIPDSIVDYADSLARDIRVATVRLSIDTFGWHNDVRRFAKGVDHLWALGGVANKQLRGFDLPRIPYFVVVDTAGTQIYRGTSLPVLP